MSEKRPIVLVTGGRNHFDGPGVTRELDALNPRLVVHGGATGVDADASSWARTWGVQEARFPITHEVWNVEGKSAGPKRNALMLLLPIDLVLAFPGGRGTENCVKQAEAAGIPVRRVK